MNIKDIRYRINTLVKLARTTTDGDLREQWVVEAKDLLDTIGDDVSETENDFWTDFLTDNFDMEREGKTPRTEVYEVYLNYCKKQSEEPLTRHDCYEALRKLGIYQTVVNGQRYIKLKRK